MGQTAKSVAPAPLILTTASWDQLGLLLNFAESVRRTRGRSGLQALVVIALDRKLEAALPPQIKAVPVQQLADDIGFQSHINDVSDARSVIQGRLRIRVLKL